MTEHSPLGGSGAYRWMPCPGSVALSWGVPDEESEYASVGIAAHALGELCLRSKADAWRCVGFHFDGENILHEVGGNKSYIDSLVKIDKDMADAVQVYLDVVRSTYPDFKLGFSAWVEHEFHCPEIHELCWGKVDFAFLEYQPTGVVEQGHIEEMVVLHLWDYKHGVGVVVEVVGNPQLMYYACGMLTELNLWDEVDVLNLHVAQPNGFHHDGPLRSWSISTDDLWDWMHLTLVPAMDRAMVSRDTASGEHCRFCPARARACPQLLTDFDELEEMLKMFTDADAAPKLNNAQVGRFLDLLDVAKIAGNAAGKTGFGFAMAGERVPGRKLVKVKSNRVWKDDAEAELREKFGMKAYMLMHPLVLKLPAKEATGLLKSPSEIDKLPEGKKMTARYAFKPDKGLTLAREDDARMAVKKDVKALFEEKSK